MIADARGKEARDLLEPALVELASVAQEQFVRLRLLVARARMGMNEVDEPAAIVEEMLLIAERRGYLDLIFDGFFIKGNLLWRMGRWREAIAVSDGARKLAQENGMTDQLIRIMSGFANVASEFDMGEAIDATREVMAIARRTGRRDELMSALSNF